MFEAGGAAKAKRNVVFSAVARLHSQQYEGATRSKLKFANWVAAPRLSTGCVCCDKAVHISDHGSCSCQSVVAIALGPFQ